MENKKFSLTKREVIALQQLDKSLKILGERHWFFAASGTLQIMRFGKDGKRSITEEGGMDQKFIVTDVGKGCDIDGGDW